MRPEIYGASSRIAWFLAAQEVEKQMSELQVRYDTQKKELEIKRLKELQQQEELRSLRLTIWFIAFYQLYDYPLDRPLV